MPLEHVKHVHIRTVVGIFLVAGLGEDVVLDALFAERVHALEALGIAEVFQTDLTHKELVVQFLCQADAVPAARHRPVVYLFLVVAANVRVDRRG